MKYKNPVVKGFFPDPSVCFAEGKYYLVCSSFQYFPGVPLFESEDLVNWTQIGYVLTRTEQIMLDKIPSSGGVFAPTIRYHDGRFYMVTTNDTTHENFYVYTDDIRGKWSDPIPVDQGGIDPSLLFDDGHVYFVSNGSDDFGDSGVVQCEIDIATGKKLSASKCIWHGSGGRYLESPHVYKIGDYYYLMAAEGGTEYGHMVTYARSKSIWGPFDSYPKNPVLTNRNKAPYIIQGIGHGDLVQDRNGGWHILTLGFRQIHMLQPFHHLGREVFLMPVTFGADGWFTAGLDGTADEEYEIEGDFEQKPLGTLTFENTRWDVDWSYLRKPVPENYELSADKALLHGSKITLFDTDSPTFIALRQRDFCFELSVRIKVLKGEGFAGVTLYHTETEHYDIGIQNVNDTPDYCSGMCRANIGGLTDVKGRMGLRGDHSPIKGDTSVIRIEADAFGYKMYADTWQGEFLLGYGQTKFLSSEVCGGFTGVMIGLFAEGEISAEFTDFSLKYL